MICLVWSKDLAIILTDVFSLMVSALFFSVPKRLVDISVTVLASDFAGDPRLIDFQFRSNYLGIITPRIKRNRK